MKNAVLSSVVSVLALSFTIAVAGCAADGGEVPETQGETTSKLSCKRVPMDIVVAGRVVKASKVVCDGSAKDTGTGTGSGTSSCTVNGRKMTCEGGGCRAVNGQPGEGCRWLDGADAPAKDPGGANDPAEDPDGADAPAQDPADGESSCNINGRKAVCENGGCIAVNGQPGPGCRFID